MEDMMGKLREDKEGENHVEEDVFTEENVAVQEDTAYTVRRYMDVRPQLKIPLAQDGAISTRGRGPS